MLLARIKVKIITGYSVIGIEMHAIGKQAL
jgi:hypothetical protein